MLTAQHPNHIWGCDITYIRLRHGWLYLVAIIDWFSRYVISWMLDETLEIGFVLAAIGQARARAIPQIWNTDQGSHFTSPQVTQPLEAAGVQISMDGKGRALDNIFTERLWRSLKYEEVYLADYGTSTRCPPRDCRLFHVLQHRAAASGARLPPPRRSLSWVGRVGEANRIFWARAGRSDPGRGRCAPPVPSAQVSSVSTG